MNDPITGSISPYVRYLGITIRDRHHLPHTHSMEIDSIFIHVLEGEGEHLVDGRLCPLREGVLEIIPPCAYQTILVTGECPLAIAYIHFDWFETEESGSVLQDGHHKQPRRDIPEKEMLTAYRAAQAPLESRSRIAGLHRRIGELHGREGTSAALIKKASMLELIALFLDSPSLAIPADPSPRTGHVARMIRYVALNFADPQLDYVRIARHINMNAGYLSGLIREQLGIPLSAYIRHVRITRAREMLALGEPVTEVARRCGYASLQAFSRAFRQHTGVPPSRWRDAAPPGGMQGPGGL